MTLMDLELHHRPALVPETLDALDVQPGGRYIDATLGEGGHANAVLRAASPGGQLLGLDADPEAVSVARDRLSGFEQSFLAVNENFRDIRAIALQNSFVPVHGVIFDLGVSSLQLDVETRGFSFRRPDPLDMRFGLDQKTTAADIVNSYTEVELADLIYHLGEDRSARKLARAIVGARPVTTSGELAEIVKNALPRRRSRIHPATRTFQALRIAVNDELAAIESALEQAVSVLGQGGRLVAISYHSLEDRIVKNFMRRQSSECVCPPGTPICICSHRPTLKLIRRRAVVPTETEIKANPRSRSARLRAAERI